MFGQALTTHASRFTIHDQTMNDKNNNRLRIKIAQLAWPVCLLGFAIPFSRIELSGTGYFQVLLKTYPGQTAFGIVLALALLQFAFFFWQKKWLAWPGLVAGIYLLVLVVRLAQDIFGSFPKTDGNSLALVMKAENQPQAGLYLLGIASLALLATALVQWINQRKNRAFASPMNS
jgi:hypothetical protein